MRISIASKLLIQFHLKSLQSVTSSNNQYANGLCFCGMFNIVVKSVIFLNKDTFTLVLLVQDERDMLK